MLDPPGVKVHIGLLVEMGWRLQSVLCFVVSILVVCPTGIHRISTCQWLLWRNCLGYYCLSIFWLFEQAMIHWGRMRRKARRRREGSGEDEGMRMQGRERRSQSEGPLDTPADQVRHTKVFSKFFLLLKTWSFWFCEFSRRASQKAQSRAIPIMTNWWWVPNISLIFSHFLWSHAMEQKDSCICLDICPISILRRLNLYQYLSWCIRRESVFCSDKGSRHITSSTPRLLKLPKKTLWGFLRVLKKLGWNKNFPKLSGRISFQQMNLVRNVRCINWISLVEFTGWLRLERVTDVKIRFLCRRLSALPQ